MPPHKKPPPVPPRPPKARKATAAIVEARITAVMEMLSVAKSTSEIYAANLELGWGLCRRQIDNYVARANQALDRVQLASRKATAVKTEQQLDRIIAFALANPTAKGALAACVAALRLKADIRGLRAPTRLEHTGRDGGPIETTALTDEQRAEQISQLLEAARQRAAEAVAEQD